MYPPKGIEIEVDYCLTPKCPKKPPSQAQLQFSHFYFNSLLQNAERPIRLKPQKSMEMYSETRKPALPPLLLLSM
jgi:hypothetical protein